MPKTSRLPLPITNADGPYPDSRYMTVSNLRLHTVGRDHATTPLYLAHHFYGSGANFRPLISQLPVTTVALDRPGFGFSERPKRTRHTKHLYTRRGQALLAWELLDMLYGNEPVVLAGASAGGTHVLEMADLKPDRVKAVMLIDAAITGDVGPPGWARPVLRTPGISRIGVAVVDAKAHTVTSQRVGRSWADPSRVTDAHVDPYRRATTMPGYAYGLYHSFVGDTPPDLRGALTRLSAPTLVLSGSHDRVISPRDAQRITAAIPHGTYHEIADAGHTPHEEQPTAVAAAITRFLADV